MDTQSRFDREAPHWDGNPVRIELARAVCEGIRRAIVLQPKWRVLDYGAGTGLVTLNLQPQVGSMIAVDSSAGMLEVLANKVVAAGIENVETRQWDLETEAFPESDFDMVVSSMTLHHIRDVPQLFQRFASLLKPGGRIALADLDAEDGTFHTDSTGVFHNGFAHEDIGRWLAEAGFCEIDVWNIHQVNKPDASGQMRAYDIFLATARK